MDYTSITNLNFFNWSNCYNGVDVVVMDTKSKNLINNYCTTIFRMGIPSLLPPKSTGTGKSVRLCMWKIPKGSNLGGGPLG